MTKASEDALNTLHALLAKEFAKRIESGEASAGDLSAARQFLRDNSITATAPEGSPLGNLVEKMPFSADEDSASSYN
ncbi:hypothetical protein [Martelella mangrovi]|uniref:Uncharacterized protein n=1 Tax=Martelella mangrovi TaxID=1397477 RepID=A0ABV2IDW7_9HYPH